MNPKFCSQSCSAKYNNKGVRRHGKPAGECVYCGATKASAGRKYCSQQCSANARKKDPKLVSASNAARQAKYRAKHGYNRAYASNADKALIKEIYANCPPGHEVDHIIPLAKGGLHHQDNLQYLTVRENRSKGAKILN